MVRPNSRQHDIPINILSLSYPGINAYIAKEQHAQVFVSKQLSAVSTFEQGLHIIVRFTPVVK